MSTSTHTMTSIDLKKIGHFAAVWGLALLGLLTLAALEFRSGEYAFATAPADNPLKPAIYTITSVAFGLLAFVGMAVAGILRRDMRRRFSAGALAATVVALGCMTVPVHNLAASIAYDRELKAWEANGPTAERPQGSDVYQKALAVYSDASEMDYRRDEAQKIITPPTVGHPGLLEWLMACFWHMLVMWSARAFQLPAPITESELRILEAERLAALRSERAKKGAQTRKRNAAAKKAPAKAPKSPNVLAFGK
jgi:hypothetical protein